MKDAKTVGPSRPGSLVRTLRIGAYFSLLTLVAGIWAARRASAELTEQSLAWGRRLDSFQEFAGQATRLSWNGQELTFSSLLVERPVAEVLERFVSACAREKGSVAEELARVEGLREGAAGLLDQVMVMRDLFEDGSGTGVCLAGLAEGGLAGLSRRIGAFGRSRDLAELGQLRFARFRTTEHGHTHVLLVTSDASLRLEGLVPTQGHDAEGEDAIAGLRPKGSLRIASAKAHGTPLTFTAYQSSRAADEAIADYGAQLRARSYAPIVHPRLKRELPLGSGDEIVLNEAYRKGPEAYVVTAQASEGGGSVLSVVRLGELPIPGPHDGAEVGRSRVGRGALRGPRDPAFE